MRASGGNSRESRLAVDKCRRRAGTAGDDGLNRRGGDGQDCRGTGHSSVSVGYHALICKVVKSGVKTAQGQRRAGGTVQIGAILKPLEAHGVD